MEETFATKYSSMVVLDPTKIFFITVNAEDLFQNTSSEDYQNAKIDTLEGKPERVIIKFPKETLLKRFGKWIKKGFNIIYYRIYYWYENKWGFDKYQKKYK